MIAVLLLQLGFITSYVGALHEPRPHELSIAVVAPPQVSPSWSRHWSRCRTRP
ncbi:hypothetical protein ACFQ0M_30245 [Kitasatospora aburaviensis]